MLKNVDGRGRAKPCYCGHLPPSSVAATVELSSNRFAWSATYALTRNDSPKPKKGLSTSCRRTNNIHPYWYKSGKQCPTSTISTRPSSAMFCRDMLPRDSRMFRSSSDGPGEPAVRAEAAETGRDRGFYNIVKTKFTLQYSSYKAILLVISLIYRIYLFSVYQSKNHNSRLLTCIGLHITYQMLTQPTIEHQ